MIPTDAHPGVVPIHVPSYLPRNISDYREMDRHLESMLASDPVLWRNTMRVLGRMDMYFLMRNILSTSTWPNTDVESTSPLLFDSQWYLWFCRVAQFAPNDTLNVVFRGGGKTTVGSFGKPIHRMIENANMTAGMFSVTKDISMPMVELVKVELETNDLLKSLYPDRFYANPTKESPRWTTDRGITIKRPHARKDATLRPFGLLDSVSTSVRLSDAFYDDVVNEKTVENPDVNEKCNRRWEMSLNLGFPGSMRYYWGTFYAGGDTYHHMIDRGVGLNHMPCYQPMREKSTYRSDGIPIQIVVDRNRPVFFGEKFLNSQETIMGPTTFAIQMLGAPASFEVTAFKQDWFKFYSRTPHEVADGANVLIFVDPASARGTNKHSRTAMSVIAFRGDQNMYLLDGVLDRLTLAQRGDCLFELVRRWNPQMVFYEQQGHAADIEHFEYRMEMENFRFPIQPVKGNIPKDKRIDRLIPIFRDSRFWFPKQGIPYLMRENGRDIDIVEWLIERELLPFPNVQHLDFVDSMSRVNDESVFIPWPEAEPAKAGDAWRHAWYSADENDKKARGWMAS